jgi:uncharacterized membrane protein YkoI
MRTKIRSSIAVVAIVALSSVVARAAEEKIKPDDLPKSVASSLNTRFPGLKIVSATRETEADGKVIFDVELTQKGRKYETDIQKDGTILEVEKEIMSKNWPSALRSTVASKFKDGKIKEVLEVNKVIGGKEVPDHLEVDVETADKKSAEILVSLDGKTEVHEQASAPAKPAADEDIKPSELPSVITQALKEKFPKAEIKSAEKGEEEGKPIYEVSISSDKHDIDVTLSTKGEILSYEKTIKPNERPKVMNKSLNAKYPHATVQVIEQVWEHDKLTGYEGVIVMPDKKKVEVTFDPKGKLIESKK